MWTGCSIWLVWIPEVTDGENERCENTLLMREPIILLICFQVLVSSAQNPTEIPLYEGAIPNSKPFDNLEKTAVNEWGVWFTVSTSFPSLTAYLPDKPNGLALIICPGGGYGGTACNHEGSRIAEVLNTAGVTVFVLKYRTPDDRWCIDKSIAPLQDAQQAIRLVRKNAAKWKIQPDKIGILGFSAGGHLAATAATHFECHADSTIRDTTSVRPDFVALIYPVISFTDSIGHQGSRDNLLGRHPNHEQILSYSNEMQVTALSPPAFLVHAGDDMTVKVENSLAYYRACLSHGVSAEIHLYPAGGHGFGLVNPTTDDRWPGRLLNWMNRL